MVIQSSRIGVCSIIHSTGLRYESGCGTEQSYDKAVLWYNKAKEAGIETSMDYLMNLLPRMWSKMYNEAKEAGIEISKHYLWNLYIQTSIKMYNEAKVQD